MFATNLLRWQSLRTCCRLLFSHAGVCIWAEKGSIARYTEGAVQATPCSLLFYPPLRCTTPAHRNSCLARPYGKRKGTAPYRALQRTFTMNVSSSAAEPGGHVSGDHAGRKLAWAGGGLSGEGKEAAWKAGTLKTRGLEGAVL